MLRVLKGAGMSATSCHGAGGLPDQEARRCALLVRRHALSPFAAPAGLAATVHCCSLALAHCRALQALARACARARPAARALARLRAGALRLLHRRPCNTHHLSGHWLAYCQHNPSRYLWHAKGKSPIGFLVRGVVLFVSLSIECQGGPKR